MSGLISGAIDCLDRHMPIVDPVARPMYERVKAKLQAWEYPADAASISSRASELRDIAMELSAATKTLQRKPFIQLDGFALKLQDAADRLEVP